MPLLGRKKKGTKSSKAQHSQTTTTTTTTTTAAPITTAGSSTNSGIFQSFSQSLRGVSSSSHLAAVPPIRTSSSPNFAAEQSLSGASSFFGRMRYSFDEQKRKDEAKKQESGADSGNDDNDDDKIERKPRRKKPSVIELERDPNESNDDECDEHTEDEDRVIDDANDIGQKHDMNDNENGIKNSNTSRDDDSDSKDLLTIPIIQIQTNQLSSSSTDDTMGAFPRPENQRNLSVPVISVNDEPATASLSQSSPLEEPPSLSRFLGLRRNNSRRRSGIFSGFGGVSLDKEKEPSMTNNSGRTSPVSDNNEVKLIEASLPAIGGGGGKFNKLKKKTFSRLFFGDIPVLSPETNNTPTEEFGTSSYPLAAYSNAGYPLAAYHSPRTPSVRSSTENGTFGDGPVQVSRSGSQSGSVHSPGNASLRGSQSGSRPSSPVLRMPPLVRSLSSQSSRDASSENDLNYATPSARPRSRTLNSLSEASGNGSPEYEVRSNGASSSASVREHRSGSLGFGSSLGSKSNIERPGSALTNLGRPSFGSLFAVRLRSDSSGSNNGSPNGGTDTIPSPRHSTEEEVDLPEKDRGEDDDGYFERIRSFLGGRTAAALAKKDDVASKELLQRYSDTYDLKDEPLDMALRKFLMYVRLPKEAQQIDRILEAFSNTYYNANPGVFANKEDVYIVVFSLMILHTDCFNRSNKYKMLKSDYIRNTYVKGFSRDVLEFIHTDEEPGLTVRAPPWTKRTSSFRNAKDLLDPYPIILENRLDVLRPKLETVLIFDNPYRCLQIPNETTFMKLRREFVNCRYLQLVSQRSRPEAFLSPDPERSDPGMVDIKIVKIGVVYRREARRMIYSKPTWREWGAILTASQLYLFKDVAWIRSVANSGQTIIRPPPEGFHPNNVISTADMIALISNKDGGDGSTGYGLNNANADSNKANSAFQLHSSVSFASTSNGTLSGDNSIHTLHSSATFPAVSNNPHTGSGLYSTGTIKERHSFVLGGRGGAQDWFATDSEWEYQDWMAKINMAGCFNSYHVAVNGDHGTVLDQVVDQRLTEINSRIEKVEHNLEEGIRNGKHLRLLAPIQQRTRESVIYAAGRLAAKLDWYYLDKRRLECYRELFAWEQKCMPRIMREAKEAAMEAAVRAASTAMSMDLLFGQQPSSFLLGTNGTYGSAGANSALPPSERLPQVVSKSAAQDRDLKELKDLHDLMNDLDEYSGQPLSPQSSSESSPAPSLRDIERMHTENPGSKTSPERAISSNSQLAHTNSSSADGQYFGANDLTTTDRLLQGAKVPESSVKQDNGDGSITVSKRPMVHSLRDGTRPTRKSMSEEPDHDEKPQRSSSLMRKEKGKFTLHGKKFTVVEVNPEFAATPNHQRTVSRDGKNLNLTATSSNPTDEMKNG